MDTPSVLYGGTTESRGGVDQRLGGVDKVRRQVGGTRRVAAAIHHTESRPLLVHRDKFDPLAHRIKASKPIDMGASFRDLLV